MSTDTVLLDLDGTLVDSVYVHTTAWKAAFRDVGVTVASHHVQRAIGMGGDRIVAHVAGQSVEDAMGDEVRERHMRYVDERFHDISATDGAGELLEALRQKGFAVVLASSADKELSERLLELLDGAGQHLHESIAGAEAEHSKPEPDLIEVALESVDATRAVMIGDAVWDVEAAARAGVRCVGLLTGGFGSAELLEAGAVAVYDSPRELMAHLDEAPFTD